MAECKACGANIRQEMKVCPACKAPIRRADRNFRDQKYGICEFNDHGIRCSKAGSIAHHAGEGGPWYCSEHALGIKGMGKKRINSGIMKIGEVMKQLEGGKNESQKEAAAERAAIQEEARQR